MTKTKFEQIAEEQHAMEQPSDVVDPVEAQETASVQEEVETTEDSTPSQPESEETQPKEVDNVQKRINRLTKERYEANQKKDYLERQNEKLLELLQQNAQKPQGQTPTQEPPALQEPREDDYDDHSDYLKAVVDYKVKQETAAIQRALQEDYAKRQEEKQKQTRQQQILSAYDETIKRGFEQYKDTPEEFEEAVNNVVVPPVGTTKFDLLIESQNSQDLIMFFHKNKSEAIKYCDMNDYEAAKFIGRFEAKLSNKPQKTVSQAPQPINPAGNEPYIGSDYKSGKISSADVKKEVSRYFSR